jgi:hypothetical protein
MHLIRTSLISLAATLVAGHASLVTVGDKPALGVKKTTGLSPANAIRVSSQNPCGPNVKLASLSAADATALNADGTLSMSVFQINGDGAGPFNVAIDASGTGKSFNTPADVTTQVPGKNGVSNAANKAFPLDIKVPAGVACSGGTSGNLCLVQVKNRSGFGGCGVIQQGAAARRAAKTARNRVDQTGDQNTGVVAASGKEVVAGNDNAGNQAQGKKAGNAKGKKNNKDKAKKKKKKKKTKAQNKAKNKSNDNDADDNCN